MVLHTTTLNMQNIERYLHITEIFVSNCLKAISLEFFLNNIFTKIQCVLINFYYFSSVGQLLEIYSLIFNYSFYGD